MGPLRGSRSAVAVARRFVDALNANDGDAVRAIYHPEARIWHSFHPDGLQSVEENVKTLNWMHRKLPRPHTVGQIVESRRKYCIQLVCVF